MVYSSSSISVSSRPTSRSKVVMMMLNAASAGQYDLDPRAGASVSFLMARAHLANCRMDPRDVKQPHSVVST